ncbi:MAG: hypothetical protein ACOX2N_03505 [Peptococcia bacterium]|jgi:hypothetical protein
MEQALKIRVPEELKKPKYCDTYRVGYAENKILLEFGFLVKDDHSEQIEAAQVVSNLEIPPVMLQHLIMSLFLVGTEYEKEYEQDIGMGLDENFEEKKEEIQDNNMSK